MYDSTCAERTESNTVSPANALISSSSVQPVVLAISARTPGDCKRIARIRSVLGLIAITSRPLALSARLVSATPLLYRSAKFHDNFRAPRVKERKP